MDYLQAMLRVSCLPLVIVLLNGCTGESDSSEPQIAAIELTNPPLEILGFPPETIYYDSPYTYTFGATGGTGAYVLDYVKHPELEEENSVATTNTVDMFIENVSASDDNDDAVRPAFKVEGLLEAPEGVDPAALSVATFYYGLELSDGVNLTNQAYEVKSAINQLTLAGTSGLSEGRPLESSIERLLAAYRNGDDKICAEVQDISLGRKEVNGVFVYPASFVAQLDAPVSKRTTIFYRTTSTYQSALQERDPVNVEAARPNVDYIPVVEGQFTLEAGQLACYVSVDIIDDGIIEADESFRVEFTGSQGAVVGYSSGNTKIEIEDDEPAIDFDPIDVVANEGSSFTIPVTLQGVHDVDVEVAFYVDSIETTASQNDYALTPASGIVTIPAFTNSTSITLDYLVNNDLEDQALASDEKIVLKTEVDEIFGIEHSEFVINDWNKSEIVSLGSSGQEAVGFTVDSSGRAVTLISDKTQTHEAATFDIRSRSGLSMSLGGLESIRLSFEGINFRPKEIFSVEGEQGRFVVVAEVDGKVADRYYGETDIAVVILALNNNGEYVIDSVSQFGTESADSFSSARSVGSQLYIGGYTDGNLLDGVPSDISNSGGTEGFLYNISLGSNDVIWNRFIGSEADDQVASIDVGNREVIALLSQDLDSLDGQVRSLSSTTKSDMTENSNPSINTLFDDFVREIRYDSNFSDFLVLADGEGVKSASDSTGASESLTHDVQVYVYDSEFTFTRPITISSRGTDIGTTMVTAGLSEKVIVGGYTDGEFSEQARKGKQDAFVAVLDDAGGSTLQLSSLIQFGTAENDRVIAIQEVSEKKFLVLWGELGTDPENETYRISAFSTDGEMLSEPL